MTVAHNVTMERPSTAWLWYHAARPRTLPAAIAPVILGSAVAWREGGFDLLIAILALVTALLLQIAANFANDAIDAKKGSDTELRTGPLRVTAAGFLSYRQVMTATILTLGIATVTGLYLVFRGGWPFVILGLAALICAVAYSGGPFPISYLGLGEVFVFLFFGLAAVTGTAWLQTGELTPLALAAAIPPGAMSVGILVVNNYRDREQDIAANKRTIAVRIGAANTRTEYIVLLAITALSPFAWWAIGWLNWTAMITVLAWPMLWSLVRQIRTLVGPPLNRTLGATGKTSLVFNGLLAIALILSA